MTTASGTGITVLQCLCLIMWKVLCIHTLLQSSMTPTTPNWMSLGKRNNPYLSGMSSNRLSSWLVWGKIFLGEDILCQPKWQPVLLIGLRRYPLSKPFPTPRELQPLLWQFISSVVADAIIMINTFFKCRFKALGMKSPSATSLSCCFNPQNFWQWVKKAVLGMWERPPISSLPYLQSDNALKLKENVLVAACSLWGTLSSGQLC